MGNWYKRPLRWIAAGILAVLLPKCLACVAGYLALVSGFGVVTPELCGAVAGEAALSQWWFAVATAAFFIGAFWLMMRQYARGIEEVAVGRDR